MAIKVHEVDLSETLQPMRGLQRYEAIRILVRHHGHPLGWVVINNEGRHSSLSVDRLREEISAHLPWELIIESLGRNFASPGETDYEPSCSVVVCTRDRTQMLAKCLRALGALDYPDYEVIVVDNAPSTDATARLVQAVRARYCRENRPGLDWARNRGIAEAKGEIIAFVDDDARPDKRWLRAIAAAFAEPEVMVVSGMVAPAELETRAQILFELALGGMTQSTRRWTVRRGGLTRNQLLWSSSYGVGTNMAFRHSLFDNERAFDVALDVGTPSGSGGDLEMFQRLVARGYTLVYEPAALVWHVHRRSETDLARQLRANGLGFGSYLWTCMRNRTAKRLAIIGFALCHWLWDWILRRVIRPRGVPRRLIWAELRGALRSPLAYRASRQHARRLATRREGDELPIAPNTIDPEPSNFSLEADPD